MFDGQIGSKGEVYRRCNACGDSNTPGHAHMACYPEGSSYCFRCGDSQKLSIKALLAIASGDISVEEALEIGWEEWETGQSFHERRTCLEVLKSDDFPDHYVFEMRGVNGELRGYHCRDMKSKKFHNVGKRGYGFNGSLVSYPDRPLVIVEGPWDVIEEHYVCVFGSISLSTLKTLALHNLWLFPDYDVINSAQKRSDFVSRVVKPALDIPISILGVMFNGGDPDELSREVQYRTLDQVLTWERPDFRTMH